MAGLKADQTRLGQARAATVIDGKPLSQVDAARRLGVHAVTLNKLENGKANVSLDLLERMCNLYGCTREYLLGEPEQVDPVEAAKGQIAQALVQVGRGLAQLAELVETLNGRAAEHVPARKRVRQAA